MHSAGDLALPWACAATGGNSNSVLGKAWVEGTAPRALTGDVEVGTDPEAWGFRSYPPAVDGAFQVAAAGGAARRAAAMEPESPPGND